MIKEILENFRLKLFQKLDWSSINLKESLKKKNSKFLTDIYISTYVNNHLISPSPPKNTSSPIIARTFV